MPRQRLVLYGRSVILGTVGASLQHCPTVEVIPLSPPLPAPRDLVALAPDIVIFDVEATPPLTAFPLLEAFPNLLLIGVNPSTDKVLLWSGAQMRAVSAQDLIDVIDRRLAGPPANVAGPQSSAVR